jgi:hypothetical protein
MKSCVHLWFLAHFLECEMFQTKGAEKIKTHFILIVVFPCILINTQLLFQQNALVFIKSTRYYNLYFLSLYS